MRPHAFIPVGTQDTNSSQKILAFEAMFPEEMLSTYILLIVTETDPQK